MRNVFTALAVILILASCKTYEQYGGIRWNNAYQAIDRTYPVEVFAARVSDDSSLFVIKFVGTEKSKNTTWPDSLPLSFTVYIDTTGGDKFRFHDSTSLNIGNQFIATRKDVAVTKAFSNRAKIRWMWVNIQGPSFSYRGMVEIPTANVLAPLIVDTNNIPTNPLLLHTGVQYRIAGPLPQSAVATHYPFPRSPAPPVFRADNSITSNLLPDTTLPTTFAYGLRFTDDGVYRIDDSITNRTFVLSVHQGNFPEIKTADEMVKPLRYITKNEEYNPIVRSANPRAAIDSFWIEKSKADVIARKSIRVFYNRVEEANRLYTTYIPGWMTDRGLMLVMYGPPDRAFKFKEGEIWSYSRNFPRNLEFVFVRSENFLGMDYELRRSQDYLSSWNQQSFKWRTGGILNDVQDIY